MKIQTYWRTSSQRKLEAKNILNVLRAKNQIDFIQNRASKKVAFFFQRLRRHRICLKATLSIQKWFKAYTPLMRARILNRGFKRLQVRIFYLYLHIMIMIPKCG